MSKKVVVSDRLVLWVEGCIQKKPGEPLSARETAVVSTRCSSDVRPTGGWYPWYGYGVMVPDQCGAPWYGSGYPVSLILRQFRHFGHFLKNSQNFDILAIFSRILRISTFWPSFRHFGQVFDILATDGVIRATDGVIRATDGVTRVPVVSLGSQWCH